MSKCNYMEKHILCPFYKRFDTTNKVQIVCEGIEQASSSRMAFSSIRNMKEYAMERCAKHYCLCPLFRGLYEYEEGRNA